MRKSLLTVAMFLLPGSLLFAQTLFTYGNDSVSVATFMKAYQKNNAAAATGKRSTVAEYLDLYINARLKIREAERAGYDTLPQLVSDLQNLRTQIMPNYLNETAAVDKLVKEAVERAQKDIHLSHIFISWKQNGLVDSAAALSRMAEASGRLQKGEPFAAVAKALSDDPGAKTNGGDLGYITVFSLPYELENLAYQTPVGKLSAVYRSKAGLHLFLNRGERKALGTIKAAQILLATPPGAGDAEKTALKKRADSIYKLLVKGADFAKLATRFSNDVISAASGGTLAEFGVGEYDPVFEAAVFALQKDGQVSRPFQTTHGWHIVKRISHAPVKPQPDAIAMETIREKVAASDRMATTRNALLQKAKQHVSFRKENFSPELLWIYSDSALNFKTPARPHGFRDSTVLIRFSDRNIMAGDWISYARTFRYRSDGSGIKPYKQLWQEFEETAILDQYRNNLERYVPEFAAQIAEFREGNLFFEIMQRKIWGPAQGDSAALEKYYTNNRARYQWTRSADAVIFYTGDAKIAKESNDALTKSPKNWKKIADKYNEQLAADSNRFEITQIPGVKKMIHNGMVTPVVMNPTDKSLSYAYVIRIYEKPEQKSFEAARGQVINDYQEALEKLWLQELRTRYPVKINEAELAKLQ